MPTAPNDPPPARPSVPLPDDVKNYAEWLNRQVNALDTAVQKFIADPQQPLSQKEAVAFVVTVGSGFGWNKWFLKFKWFIAKNFEVIPLPGILPVPIEIPAFDWDSVQRFQVEMEGWRSQFQSLGVPVPGRTDLPPEGKPPLEGLGNLGIGLGIAATAVLIGYLTYKFA